MTDDVEQIWGTTLLLPKCEEVKENGREPHIIHQHLEENFLAFNRWGSLALRFD